MNKSLIILCWFYFCIPGSGQDYCNYKNKLKHRNETFLYTDYYGLSPASELLSPGRIQIESLGTYGDLLSQSQTILHLTQLLRIGVLNKLELSGIYRESFASLSHLNNRNFEISIKYKLLNKSYSIFPVSLSSGILFYDTFIEYRFKAFSKYRKGPLLIKAGAGLAYNQFKTKALYNLHIVVKNYDDIFGVFAMVSNLDPIISPQLHFGTILFINNRFEVNTSLGFYKEYTNLHLGLCYKIGA